MTRVYLQFLADQRANFEAGMLDLWKIGRLETKQSDELRGRVLTLDELHELTYSSMAEFYGLEANNPEDA